MKCLQHSAKSWIVFLIPSVRSQIRLLQVLQAEVGSLNVLIKNQYDTIAVENEIADNMYQRSELDYLIYNDPVGYAELILNGDPETYLKTATEYKPLDS